ncbi:E3 ubiquitin-protein ligase Mdm2 [Neosynchiropus ocellatus]
MSVQAHGNLNLVTMSASQDLNTSDDNKLVRPKLEFHSLLQHAGATKDVLTMKEVMFYLGRYIMQKQLYDQKQQHMVYCAQDALGQLLGVESFSVKDPSALFAMITKNLVAVKSHEGPQSSSQPLSSSAPEQLTEEPDDERLTPSPDTRRWGRRRRRSHRSSDPGPSHTTQDNELEDASEDEDHEERKRRRSDSYSLTFDESLSWCVIGGLRGGQDRDSSRSPDSHSASTRSEVTGEASDSDHDNFSVEFEVESIDSDDYDEDDASLSADDQVYEVTIFEADDDDSFDEDTEITEADYWRCAKCDELNPPLPRNCLRCWTLRQDWLRDAKNFSAASLKSLPPKPVTSAEASAGSDNDDGVDVPDGKGSKTPADDSASSGPNSQDFLSSSEPCSSQEKLWNPDSQPSSSCYSSADSQELVSSSPTSSSHLASSTAAAVPDMERSISAESRLPDSCLDPCLICQSRPKNGCIVHGRTGHLMSCYVCARKLKKRNKLCPVCRLPIQSVVLTYLS